MSTGFPAKKGVAYDTYVSLVSLGTPNTFQSSATLAAGDVKVSIDGGAFANITTLPTVTPAAGKQVKVSLSLTEMTGDSITVLFSDVAGAEWQDLLIVIPTAVRQLADLAYPATSGRSMVVDAAGLVDANTVKVGPTGSGTAQTGRDIGASVLLSAGSGTGQLDFTSGVVKSNLSQILGTVLTETAGLIAAAFKQFFNVATPTGTMKAITNVVTTTNLTNAPTNGDFTATMKTSIGTAVAASDVASVTGAVGSVTGNIGGNVTGSVGSLAAQAQTDVKSAMTSQGYTTTRAGYLDTLNGLVAAIWSSATRLLTAGTNIVLAKGTGITGFTDLSATGVENAVWDATLASHLTGGSTGAALNAAGSAGDPWGTALPGAYSAGSAGYIIGTDLDATISSRTKPADTQAAVTLVTTTTNLTNAPPDSSGVTTLLSRLSAARAGYLDTLNGLVSAIWAAVTDSAGVTTLLARLTATRAGYLDNLNFTYTAPDNTTVGAINTKLGTPATSVSADIAALNDFNPASDVVAHVTLVDTTTDLTNGGGGLDAAGVRAAVGLASANLDTQLDALPTNAELATALGTADDATLAAIAALNDFNPASDVVAHVTLVDTTTDVTNSSTFTIDDTTGNKIADYVWRRSSANIELSASGDTLSARSGYGVIAWLTHKKSTVGATLTVTKSNDTTTLTTAALTSDVAAEPVTGIDPA